MNWPFSRLGVSFAAALVAEASAAMCATDAFGGVGVPAGVGVWPGSAAEAQPQDETISPEALLNTARNRYGRTGWAELVRVRLTLRTPSGEVLAEHEGEMVIGRPLGEPAWMLRVSQINASVDVGLLRAWHSGDSGAVYERRSAGATVPGMLERVFGPLPLPQVFLASPGELAAPPVLGVPSRAGDWSAFAEGDAEQATLSHAGPGGTTRLLLNRRTGRLVSARIVIGDLPRSSGRGAGGGERVDAVYAISTEPLEAAALPSPPGDGATRAESLSALRARPASVRVGETLPEFSVSGRELEGRAVLQPLSERGDGVVLVMFRARTDASAEQHRSSLADAAALLASAERAAGVLSSEDDALLLRPFRLEVVPLAVLDADAPSTSQLVRLADALGVRSADLLWTADARGSIDRLSTDARAIAVIIGGNSRVLGAVTPGEAAAGSIVTRYRERRLP